MLLEKQNIEDFVHTNSPKMFLDKIKKKIVNKVISI